MYEVWNVYEFMVNHSAEKYAPFIFWMILFFVDQFLKFAPFYMRFWFLRTLFIIIHGARASRSKTFLKLLFKAGKNLNIFVIILFVFVMQ